MRGEEGVPPAEKYEPSHCGNNLNKIRLTLGDNPCPKFVSHKVEALHDPRTPMHGDGSIFFRIPQERSAFTGQRVT